MAEEIQKKVLIDIKLANNDAQAAMSSLETTINDVATATKELQDVTKQTQTTFNGYNEALAKSKLTAQQNREEITRLNLVKRQEKDAIDKAKGSIVAATGSYKEAQQALTKLGNAIKNAEGGFNNATPAIRRQITEYNKLNTQLKNFDAEMGNHQRKVGSYKEALSGLEGILDRLVPGFGQFSTVLKDASKSFGFMPMKAKETEGAITSMAKSTANAGIQAEHATIGFKNFQTGATAAGESAETAETATEGLGVAALGLGAAFLGVAAAGAGLIEYFKDVSTVSDRLSNDFAGLKASWIQFINNIREGDWSPFNKNISQASDKAKELNQDMIDLNRAMLISEVESNKENQFIATQMLKIRNLHTTTKEAEEIFKQVQETAEEQYQRVSQESFKGYQTVAEQIKNTAGLTEKEMLAMMAEGVKAATAFKEEGKHISDDLLEKFAKFQAAIDSAEGLKDQIEQRAQNREEQRIARNEKASASDLARQQKEAEEIAKIKAGTEQANSERIASISRMLDFRREAFAKELADSDEHYRQLIFKQREFIAKMQVIADSKKSTGKEKSAARGGIGAANALIGQLSGEQTANQQKLIEDHAKVILAESQKAANDLANLQISGIKDTEERERQSENLSYKEKKEASDKEISLLKENQEKLNIDIAKATGERLAILKKELEDTQVLIDVANDKKIETQLQHDQKLLEIKKKAAIESKLLQDQLDIISANNKPGFFGGTNNPFNKDIERAAISDVKDTGQKQLINQGLDGDKNADGSGFSKQQVLQKLSITKNTEDQITKIKRDAEKKRRDATVDMAKQATDATFSIIQQSMERSFQAQEAMMNRQKDHDLQNTSLTETQKYVVKEKYRIKEGQAKVKQFKQEQELAIVKGIIDTAAAVIKAAPNPYLMALAGIAGAIEIGVIAAQKPPAFAKGGIYNSDGKGGVLPGYSKTDNTNARLRSGEGVVVSEAMRDPWARNVVSAINQSYGGRSFDGTVPASSWVKPGFASGGVFSNYLPTGDNGLRPRSGLSNNGRLHPDDISGIGRAVSQIKFPPIVTDIKDVNFQNQILSNVQDRRNY